LLTRTFIKKDEGALGPVVDGIKKAAKSKVGKGLLEGAAVVGALGAAAGGIAVAIASRNKPTTTPSTLPPTTTPPPTTTFPRAMFRHAATQTPEAGSSSSGSLSSSSNGGLIGLLLAIIGCCVFTACIYFVLIKVKQGRRVSEYDENSYSDEDAQDQDYEE
jgi:hypothetical protein